MSGRIVFMGTPDFAVASLTALHESDHEVLGVVTAPDRPAGRGQKIRISPVKQFALENEIKVLQPEKLKDPDFLNSLADLKADIFVVVAFRMLPEIVWKMPKLGTFNLHASLLPQYRGAAPLNWVLINGESETGVTSFMIDEKIDTGKIILQEKIPVSENTNAGQLHDSLMLLGAELVVKTADLLTEGGRNFIPQSELIPEQELKPAPKIFKNDCKINWDLDNIRIHNLVRGLSPYPGAWTILENSSQESFSAKILKSEKVGSSTHKPPGSVEVLNGDLIIHCGSGALKILSLQPEGKRLMDSDEFLRGYRNKLTRALW